MSEARACPKCNGRMHEAHRLVAHTRVLAGISLAKKGDIVGDKITPYYCGNCGYIEFFKEIKTAEQPQEQGFLKTCVKCGKRIPIASEICQHCGADQVKKRNSQR